MIFNVLLQQTTRFLRNYRENKEKFSPELKECTVIMHNSNKYSSFVYLYYHYHAKLHIHHSSKIRVLCLMKWLSVLLQNKNWNFSFGEKIEKIKKKPVYTPNYCKFWSVSLSYFIKHKMLISEELAQLQ